MITVHYFAGLREITGKSEEQIDRDTCSVHEMRQWAVERYPDIAHYAILVAVNEEYALDEDLIHRGDIVAFIPPVSGG